MMRLHHLLAHKSEKPGKSFHTNKDIFSLTSMVIRMPH